MQALNLTKAFRPILRLRFYKPAFQLPKSLIPGSDSMLRKAIPIDQQITNGNKAKMSKAEIEQNSSSLCNPL
jgi:hypothetical protein